MCSSPCSPQFGFDWLVVYINVWVCVYSVFISTVFRSFFPFAEAHHQAINSLRFLWAEVSDCIVIIWNVHIFQNYNTVIHFQDRISHFGNHWLHKRLTEENILKIRIHFNVGCYLAFGRKEQKVVTDELIGQRALLTVGYWLHHRMIPVDLIKIIWLHRQ